MPLYKRHRVIVSVMNECLGLYNKPKVEVHPGHKEEEEEDLKRYNSKLQLLTSAAHIAVITTPYSNRPVLLSRLHTYVLCHNTKHETMTKLFHPYFAETVLCYDITT